MKCLKSTTDASFVVKLETRVLGYPGFVIARLRRRDRGTRRAIPAGMKTLTPEQTVLVKEVIATAATSLSGDDLTAMPLVEAKRLAAAEFERRYLVCVMDRAGGSVSEAARLSGLDRTNFRRLLQRHDLR